MNTSERLLNTSEVAKMLHLHANTVRRYADKGIIKSYRIGTRGDRRFALQHIADFLSSQQPRA
jgi:excisionase family DNA binding protein